MPQFDFSGVDRFWQVHDQLRSGAQVPEAQWRLLFETPGYRALVASEFRLESFVRRWTAAYHPGAVAERAEYEAKGDYLYRHFREVCRRRNELLQFGAELARRQGEIIGEADRRARLFLPAGPDYPNAAGNAAFVIFGPDARGYVPVVVDLLFAADLGGRLSLLLAHEAHHQMVAAVRGTQMGLVGFNRDDLQWVVEQIHLEGVADMVSSDPERPGPMFAATELKAVPQYLAVLDQELQQLKREPRMRLEIGARLRAGLRLSGHPVGYYMASTIVERLGQAALADVALDPGDFFEAYQRAAAAAAGTSGGTGANEGVISRDAVEQVRTLIDDTETH